jgi:hypothetical protein
MTARRRSRSLLLGGGDPRLSPWTPFGQASGVDQLPVARRPVDEILHVGQERNAGALSHNAINWTHGSPDERCGPDVADEYLSLSTPRFRRHATA